MSKVDENIRHCTIFSHFILRLLGGMICLFVIVKVKNTWWFAMSKVDENIKTGSHPLPLPSETGQ